jgi:transcriptional regulator with XRE-family HTH domain
MHHHDKAIFEQNTLAAWRDQSGFTQERLGKLLRLSDGAISKYECGRRVPSLSSLIGLELIFGKPITELYPGVARSLADHMIPLLQHLSIAIEGDEDAPYPLKTAIRAIGDRLSDLIPDA